MGRPGFFDLSLEIRQMVYDNWLPDDGKITYNFCKYKIPKGTVMASVCEADPLLREELTAWAATRCIVRIPISEHTPTPEFEDICCATRIELCITSHDCQPSEASLALLRGNISDLVAVTSMTRRLKDLTIEFDERNVKYSKSYDTFYRARGWTTNASYGPCKDGGRLKNTYNGLVLNTLESAHIPIVEYLLVPLMDLPACESAHIKSLIGVGSSYDWPFDRKYMADLFTALEKWLTGDRSTPLADFRSHTSSRFQAWRQRVETEEAYRWALKHGIVDIQMNIIDSFRPGAESVIARILEDRRAHNI